MRLKTIKESLELRDKLETEPPKSFVDWATNAAKEKNIDLSGIDMKQLAVGVEIEKEHNKGDDVDVIEDEKDLIKVAVAHLRENEKYYTILLDAEL